MFAANVNKILTTMMDDLNNEQPSVIPFEDHLCNYLDDKFSMSFGSDYKFFNNKEWKKLQKLKNKNTTSVNFDISNLNLPPVVLVYQPNGSQQWPDFTLYVNGIGLPIEAKSNKDTDKIVWNSGYPRKDALYIFKFKKTEETTWFIGSELTFKQEYKDLCEQYIYSYRELAEHFNNKMDIIKTTYPNCWSWGVYPRVMVDCFSHILEDTESRRLIENEASDFVESLKWDSSQRVNFKD